MKTIILLHIPVIQTQHGGYWFTLFYLLAFLVTIAVFMIEVRKINKLSVRMTLPVIAMGVLFFILGNKLFAISPLAWKNIFSDPAACSHEGKTILGGIIGLCLAIMISQKWLALKNNLADRLAMAVPVGMIITRPGTNSPVLSSLDSNIFNGAFSAGACCWEGSSGSGRRREPDQQKCRLPEPEAMISVMVPFPSSCSLLTLLF